MIETAANYGRAKGEEDMISDRKERNDDQSQDWNT
jgi:hypothetical protein